MTGIGRTGEIKMYGNKEGRNKIHERDGMYTCWELCVRVCTELWVPRASLLGYGGRPAAAPGWRVLESVPAPRQAYREEEGF